MYNVLQGKLNQLLKNNKTWKSGGWQPPTPISYACGFPKYWDQHAGSRLRSWWALDCEDGHRPGSYQAAASMIKKRRPRKIRRMNLNVRCACLNSCDWSNSCGGKQTTAVATCGRLLPFEGVNCLIAIENTDELDPHVTSTCMTHRQFWVQHLFET